jgi:arylsulfatase A-like enzyme
MEADRPNVLLLMSDQHSPHTMSCAGHPVVETPHMDRLADEGIRFSNAYCPTPLCAPSRVAHLTGRYGHNTGILDNGGHLPSHEPTLSGRMRDAGYHTGVIGKIHFQQGAEPGTDACDNALSERGFEDVDAHHGKVFAAFGDVDDSYRTYLKEKDVFEAFYEDYAQRSYGHLVGRRETEPRWYAAPSVLSAEDYHDAYIGRVTREWLAEYDREEPFFMWCNWGGPHAPWDAPGEYAERYDPENVDSPIDFSPDTAPDDMPPDAWRACRAHYYGMINVIDDAIGSMLDTLETQEMLENTVVIYTSDHGEMLYDHGLQGKGRMYEQSASVPLIVRWPEHYRSGATSDALVSTLDLVPTLTDLAGGDDLPVCHGRSLAGVLDGTADTHREAVFSEMGPTKMVRVGDWKYIYDPERDSARLFDLAADPEELDDRAGDPAVADRQRDLHDRLLNWMIDTQTRPNSGL